MKDISDYLKKYSKLQPPLGKKKKLIQDSIYSECAITISEQQIRLQGEGVFIDCHPVVRTEIYKAQAQIIEVLYSKHSIRIAYIR